MEFIRNILGTEIEDSYAFLGFLHDDHLYEWPKQAEAMEQFIELYAGQDVYFSPKLYAEPERSGGTHRLSQVIAIDADTCDPRNFRAHPSYIVETRPGRTHCYWVIEGGLRDDDSLKEITQKIAKAHQHQGCDVSSWNAAKLMRVPGTTNTKNGLNFPITLLQATGEIFNLEDLENLYSDIQVHNLELSPVHDLPDDLPDFGEVLDKLEDSRYIAGLIFDEPDTDADLSARMWKLEMELFRAGLTLEECFVVVQNAKCNKYVRGGELKADGTTRPHRKSPDESLWKEINKAYFQLHREQAVPEGDEEPDPALAAPQMVANLLQEWEIEESNTHTWVDTFLEWADFKTDGDHYHKVAAALTTLAIVFSKDAYIMPRYGTSHYRENLALWFICLGDSGTSRKTTVYNLMKTVVERYESATQNKFMIGGNATPEALVDILSDRENIPSLFHVDECARLFDDIKNKSYQSGADNLFMELYNGVVPAQLRMGRRTPERKTIFLQYLLGTPSKTFSVLEEADYMSGYLARFIHVIAESREMGEADNDLVEADEEHANDPMQDEVFNSLLKVRRVWHERIGVKNLPHRMATYPEALDRLNEAGRLMDAYARDSRYAETLLPAVTRLKVSLWKVSALIAIARGNEQITLTDVLITLKYGNKWFADIVQATSQVSATRWEREVTKLEMFVRSQRNGKVKYSTAYDRLFAGHEVGYFDRIVLSLAARGKIRHNRTLGKDTLEVIA